MKIRQFNQAQCWKKYIVFVLAIEKVTINSMSYEEAINKHKAKNYMGKNIVEGVRQLINLKNILFFFVSLCFCTICQL